MSNFLLIILCLVLGLILQRVPNFPKTAAQGLNAFVIYISLPAISILYIPKLSVSWQMLLPFAVGWIVLLGAWLFFKLLANFIHFDRKTLGCLILVCGLGNTSFVGFPVVQAFYGEAGLQVAIFVDQGCFLALATVGVSLAMIYSSGAVRSVVIFQRVLNFPPFIAFVFALIITALGLEVPEAAQVVLGRLGDTLTPLALVSVGLQLKFDFKSFKWRDFALGLGYKVGLAPLLIYGLYLVISPSIGLAGKVSIIEAAMPPMVTASIIAAQYGLNPALANLLVGLGLVIALPLLYFWWILLT